MDTLTPRNNFVTTCIGQTYCVDLYIGLYRTYPNCPIYLPLPYPVHPVLSSANGAN